MEQPIEKRSIVEISNAIMEKDPTIDPSDTYWMFNQTLPYFVPDTPYVGFGLPIIPICAAILSEIGIHHIVNLTMKNEFDYDRYIDSLSKQGIQVFNVPIPDMKTPTIEQVNETYAFVKPLVDAGHSVGFHCGKGLGRTAVMIASMIVKDGISGEDAVSRVQHAKQGTFVTLSQVLFVSKLSNLLAK